MRKTTLPNSLVPAIRTFPLSAEPFGDAFRMKVVPLLLIGWFTTLQRGALL